MEVMAAANARAALGHDVLHLEVGEPAGGAPPKAVAAARRALVSGPLGYTEALGLPALRRRLARLYGEWYGVAVDPARIVVTAGASGAFILAFLAAFEAGARVAVTAPGYPAYRNILQALDIEVVTLEVDAATRFQPVPATLAGLGPLDGLIVASPANPTGTMLAAEELAGLTRWCRANGVRLISDEIYHGLTYSQPAQTALATDPEALIINSFSKFFRMTGWRLGWLVAPPELIEPLTRLAQNLFISPPAIAQAAALGALEDQAFLRGRVDVYRASRDRLLHALNKAGLDRLAPPDGAFYLYADTSSLGEDSVALAREILEATGVALTPGVDFDPRRGRHFVRLSFAGDPAEVSRAAERLEPFLAARAGRWG